MMPTKERIDWLKLNHFIRMGKNGFTKQFLSELRTLNIDNSLIKEIEESTKDIPDIAELSLYDKCDIRIHEIEDEHNYAKATSKTAQLLKIIYDLSDVNEKSDFQLGEIRLKLKTLNTHTRKIPIHIREFSIRETIRY